MELRRAQNPENPPPDCVDCLEVVVKTSTFGSKAYRKLSDPKSRHIYIILRLLTYGGVIRNSYFEIIYKNRYAPYSGMECNLDAICIHTLYRSVAFSVKSYFPAIL